MRPRIALCPKCHASMTPGERFCRNCGAVICPNCQQLLPQRSRYCPRCGFLCLNEPVKEMPPPAASSSPPRQVFSGAQTFAPPPSQQRSEPAVIGEGGARTVCPQCGSAIDPDSGRCTGCGLLFGAKHRVMQTGAGSTPAAPRQVPLQQHVPRESGAGIPPPPLVHGVGTVARSGSAVPPSRFQGHVHGAAMAPAAAGTGRISGPGQFGAPVVPGVQRYRSREAVGEASGPRDLRQTLLKLVFALFVLFVIIFAGSGLYYLIAQGGSEVPVASELPPSSEPAPPAPATAPPVISDVTVSSHTDMTAVITWRTDKPATSQVRYGKTDACGLATKEDKSLVTEHSVRLSGLEANTLYYFKAVSRTAGGEKAEAPGEPFTTKGPIAVGTNKGNRAPDFTLQTIDGGSITLSQFQGSKVVLNFWATWCDPCKKEMPYIQAVHEAWRDKGVVVLTVAVNLNQTLEGVKLFIQDNKYTFTVLFDSEGKVAKLYNVSTIPVTVFIDEDGIVRLPPRVGEFASQQEIEDGLTSF